MKLVPIRTVCAMYDLNPNTLRTWERRYGLVAPERTAGGQRGYGEEDMEKIRRVLQLTSSGTSIGEAADQVNAWARDRKPHQPSAAVKEWRRKFNDAVKSLDTARSLGCAHRLVEALGYNEAVEHVFFPELRQWGALWAKDGHVVAQEHVASLAVRAALLSPRLSITENKNPVKSPVVILACVPGEQHDLPLLHLANLMRMESSLQPTLLVAGLPIADILRTCERSHAQVLVLSASITPRADVARTWLGEITEAGWEDRTIFAGGGFSNTRLFGNSAIRSAAGSFSQLVKMIESLKDAGPVN
ncbi:hypothetical protein CVU37_12035 [candidate division BRC1 bacterium HGW-BRC1-1]|nr:MAG: hypothetical protein CVU37_12035 [candidate division BRC1 bacterium HGW-BRC1-1]